MSRKKRRTRRRPAVPPATAQPRPRPGSEATATATPAPAEVAATPEEDLESQYYYVKSDLKRIAIIAVVLFAAIIGTQYLFY